MRLKGAQTGHSLLKRKSDALTARFRLILAKIHAAKTAMGQLMKAGAFAIAELNFSMGGGGGPADLGWVVREGVKGPAQVKVRARMENVNGVQLPMFDMLSEGSGNGETCAGVECYFNRYFSL